MDQHSKGKFGALKTREEIDQERMAGSVDSPFTTSPAAPDWRNPAKDLPFDTLDPLPGASQIGKVMWDFAVQVNRLEADNKAGVEALARAHAELDKLKAELTRERHLRCAIEKVISENWWPPK